MAVQKLGVTSSDEGSVRGSRCNMYEFFLYRSKKLIEKLMQILNLAVIIVPWAVYKITSLCHRLLVFHQPYTGSFLPLILLLQPFKSHHPCGTF